MGDVYKVISQSTGTHLVLFASVVEKIAFASGRTPGLDPYEGAFEGLCTMFNMFIDRVQKRQGKVQRGIIVFDEARPSLSRQIKAMMSRFHLSGGRWTRMTRLMETAFFFDSRASRIMQLADFTAYAVYRWYEVGDDRYLRGIYHRFDHERNRFHGLKCYPLQSRKLYPPPK